MTLLILWATKAAASLPSMVTLVLGLARTTGCAVGSPRPSVDFNYRSSLRKTRNRTVPMHLNSGQIARFKALSWVSSPKERFRFGMAADPAGKRHYRHGRFHCAGFAQAHGVRSNARSGAREEVLS